MENSFDISVVLKRGSDISEFYKYGTKYHLGTLWHAFIGTWRNETTTVGVLCHEDIAQRFTTGHLVESDVEWTLELAHEQYTISNKTWKFTDDAHYVDIRKTLVEKLAAHIVLSDAIFRVRITVKRTFGCRYDSLENFDQPKAFWTDQCLVVGGRKFYVNKRFLAHKSPIFKTLFKDSIFKKLFSCWKSKDITINNTDPDAFEHFLQLVHKKSPAFPVELVPQVYELAKRFKVGPAKEYIEWYMIQYGEAYLHLTFKFVEIGILRAVMKSVFPAYNFCEHYEEQMKSKSRIYLHPDELDVLNGVHCRSTMEENFRKTVKFVIPVEKTVRALSGNEPLVSSWKKECDHFGLHWTAKVDPTHKMCSLEYIEEYYEQLGEGYDLEFPPGWFITVDIDVFALIGDQKILVGTEKNWSGCCLVEVDLSNEVDWKSMPRKFEVHVKIVQAAGTRHLTLEDFSKEVKGWTDGCLVVRGRSFHVNKMNLARSSEVFAEMFKKKPGRVEKFNLKEDDPDLFDKFLQISHSGSTYIKKNDILGLVDLAKRYKSKIVMEACRNSVMHHLLTWDSEDFDKTLAIFEPLDCSAQWEVKVEQRAWHGDGFERDYDWSIKHRVASEIPDQGMNALFLKRLGLKNSSKERVWPIFIQSSSGETYILKWDFESSFESLVKEVANIENKAIHSQQLMINGVLVKNTNDIKAHLPLLPAKKCPEKTNVPAEYKDLVDGTATELSSEIREDFERFLLDCSQLGVKKRLLLADQHDFEQLLTKCLAQITDEDQLDQFADCYATLTLPVKLELYEMFGLKYPVPNCYKPKRYPMYVTIGPEDTGESVAERIGQITGQPPCREDVFDFQFNKYRSIVHVDYDTWESLLIQSINTDGKEE